MNANLKKALGRLNDRREEVENGPRAAVFTADEDQAFADFLDTIREYGGDPDNEQLLIGVLATAHCIGTMSREMEEVGDPDEAEEAHTTSWQFGLMGLRLWKRQKEG